MKYIYKIKFNNKEKKNNRVSIYKLFYETLVKPAKDEDTINIAKEAIEGLEENNNYEICITYKMYKSAIEEGIEPVWGRILGDVYYFAWNKVKRPLCELSELTIEKFCKYLDCEAY